MGHEKITKENNKAIFQIDFNGYNTILGSFDVPSPQVPITCDNNEAVLGVKTNHRNSCLDLQIGDDYIIDAPMKKYITNGRVGWYNTILQIRMINHQV